MHTHSSNLPSPKQQLYLYRDLYLYRRMYLQLVGVHLQGELATVFLCLCVCVVCFNLKSLQIVHKWQSWRVPKPSPLSTCCHILVHILGPKDRGTAWPHCRYCGTTELVACVAFCLLLLHFAWRFVFDLCSLITFLYWLSCLVFSYIYIRIYFFLLFSRNCCKFPEERIAMFCCPFAVFIVQL